MRITNQMTANKMLLNMNRNLNALDVLDTQIGTGKKIQNPSDNPIIASRALKFRTNVSQTEQYLRNVSQGISWMTVTEKAQKNVVNAMTEIRALADRASSDQFNEENRKSFADDINELFKQLGLEMNASYGGRYVFSGYRTDTPSVITKNDANASYRITQNLKVTSIQSCTVYQKFNTADAPEIIENVNRIYLPYAEVDMGNTYYQMDADGNIKNVYTINTKSKDDTTAYTPGDNEINYIHETGELILGSNVTKAMNENPKDNFMVSYTKNGLKEGDLNPVVYFNCYDNNTGKIGTPSAATAAAMTNVAAAVATAAADAVAAVAAAPINASIAIQNAVEQAVTKAFTEYASIASDSDLTDAAKLKSVIAAAVKDAVKATDNTISDSDLNDIVTAAANATDVQMGNAIADINTAAAADALAAITKAATAAGYTGATLTNITSVLSGITDLADLTDVNSLKAAIKAAAPAVTEADAGAIASAVAKAASTSAGFSTGLPRDYNNDNQEIKYEFGVNTRIAVNSQAKDAFPDSMYSALRGILDFVNNVEFSSETKIREKLLAAGNSGDKLEEMVKAQMLEEEQKYRGALQNAFSNLIEVVDIEGKQISQEYTNMGSRMNRLTAIETRLKEDRLTYYDLMNTNENIDYTEAYLQFNELYYVYQASLQIGAKINQTSLVDFIR